MAFLKELCPAKYENRELWGFSWGSKKILSWKSIKTIIFLPDGEEEKEQILSFFERNKIALSCEDTSLTKICSLLR